MPHRLVQASASQWTPPANLRFILFHSRYPLEARMADLYLLRRLTVTQCTIAPMPTAPAADLPGTPPPVQPA